MRPPVTPERAGWGKEALPADISLDDLLCFPRPRQQSLQSRATIHANARGLLEGLRHSPHSLGDGRALTAEAVTWNRDVFVRLQDRDSSRLTGKPEGEGRTKVKGSGRERPLYTSKA